MYVLEVFSEIIDKTLETMIALGKEPGGPRIIDDKRTFFLLDSLLYHSTMCKYYHKKNDTRGGDHRLTFVEFWV